jgi:hypothetical protein
MSVNIPEHEASAFVTKTILAVKKVPRLQGLKDRQRKICSKNIFHGLLYVAKRCKFKAHTDLTKTE